MPGDTVGPTSTFALKDGTPVRLRPIRLQDESELTALYSRLSPESAYQRFLTAMNRLPPSWAHILANVDYEHRMAIVAVGPGNELVGVARYDYDKEAAEAEIALVVEDGWQGKGLGTILLTELLTYAGAKGICRFRAYVLAENRRMLRLLTRVTQVLEQHIERGVTSLLLVPCSPGLTHEPTTR